MTNKRAPLKLFVSFYDAAPHGFEKKPSFLFGKYPFNTASNYVFGDP